jgi:hypothetical protein
MKHFGAHNTFRAAVTFVVLLVIVGTLAALLSNPSAHDCATDRSSDPQKIHAAKVVVEPWLGQHHVFGIFMVPLQYRGGRVYSGRITVQSFTAEFIPDQHQIQSVEDLVAEPGYYLVQGYLPTRVALWFIITGQFGELRSLCNWTLEFRERTK